MRPRLPFSRRHTQIAAAVGVALLVVAFAFGPLVRAKVAAEATRRHLDVQVGSVRPGWFAVGLLDVVVRPKGVESVQARVQRVRVGLSLGLRVESVELSGGEVLIAGDLECVREQLQRWRSERPDSAGGGGRTVMMAAEGLALRWEDGISPVPVAELHGAGVHRDAGGMRFEASDGWFRLGSESIEVRDASVQLDPKGGLTRAHAAALVLEWAPRASRPANAGPAASVQPDSVAPSASPPIIAARTAPQRSRAAPAPPKTTDPGAPIVSFPDLRAFRGRAASLALLMSQRVAEGVDVSVDAMTWKIAQDESRVAFTIGPGPLSLGRTDSRFELRFSTDTRAAATSLAVRALLPIDGGDVAVTLEGGPVSLSLLGIQEGAAGLVDVQHATVTGRARVTLAGDASALAFDAEAGTRDLSLHDPKLASDVVRGIDVELRARGALTSDGELRLDEFAATLGAIHVAGSGALEQKPDHVAASFRFELPSATCQSLLDSVPTALLPVLQSTKLAGTFGARGRFAFDTRTLDDLDLVYDIQDQCRVTEVPAALARERFKEPFPHRIYLPDGSATEHTTGPGTPEWTPLGQISPYMQVAVMTTEDGAFPHHRGFNQAAIRASIVANLKARRFVRGASTVTMQLAKNLFLSRDKTLSRKLEEVVLTDYLEQAFSKDELMELYLNVIEFGPAVYGITAAAEYYFGRTPAELNLAECLFLSSLLPSPIRFGSMRDADHAPDGWMRSVRSLMQIANKRGLVTDAELAEAQGEQVVFWHGGSLPPARPPVRARSRLDGEDADEPVPFDVPVPDVP